VKPVVVESSWLRKQGRSLQKFGGAHLLLSFSAVAHGYAYLPRSGFMHGHATEGHLPASSAHTRTVTGMSRSSSRRPVVPYIDGLMSELESIAADYDALLDASEIRNVDPNRPGSRFVFVGSAEWGWTPSSPQLTGQAMELLGRARDLRPRFELLFPHPTPAVAKKHKAAFHHLEKWLTRPQGDTSVPSTIERAKAKVSDSFAALRAARDMLPSDEWATRVVVDTNVLLDNPDLAQLTPALGGRYLVHLPPVVLRELDDQKRAGRTPELREAAKRADRRLKGLRDNGDVRTGARVAGDVFVIFEHVEPRGEDLPSWLDLGVPDDRLIASALLLQSAHPSSMVVVATSDLNVQTKLAATGLPFIEPPGAA